ncbi:hypothetical protein [Streptomyces sp. NK08204]|uniref:hypothetical protein n=1 Tax=Streptomyces sp. NK08204 TaxID=2873260 RepID=UPI001CED0E8B|nr:hypothetical protein [Streptomyces sp. NK08204]
MRIRAAVAAVSGALALSALAVPAAHAAGAPYTLNVSFSNVTIAKSIKVGTTYEVSAKYSYTLTHGSDVNIKASDFYTDAFLYKGTYDTPTAELYGDQPATCTDTSATTATCTGTVDIYPADGDLKNAWAGSWSVAAEAVAFNGQNQDNPADLSKVGYKDQSGLGTTLVQRYSKLTADATPEPVKKGSTITVAGKLTRADWDHKTYIPLASQSVKLQYRKGGTTTWTTLKTITSSSTGYLKTTTTATYDGYYRYSYAGTSTTAAVSSSADYVDVQ